MTQKLFVRVLREPLIHFLLLGAAIFVLSGFVTRHRTDEPTEIVVTQGVIENLVTGFSRTWQRPPTDDELTGLVRDYIREEGAYREAVAMGLDKDDLIVRRRLQQKLEFVSDELATRVEPSDGELERFLRMHSAMFQTEPLISFRHIYFNPQLHGDKTHQDAIGLLEHLQHSDVRGHADGFGDPFLLQTSVDDLPLSDLKKTFGDAFATQLSSLPAGAWQGPIDSGYGVHLVWVSRRTDGRLPTLAEIRDQVRNAWLEARRRDATDNFYRALLSHYHVTVQQQEKRFAQAR